MRVSVDDTDMDDQQRVLYNGEPFSGTVCETGKDDQLIAETEYRDGVQDGVSREYYPNGQLEAEEQYDFGHPQGLLRYWYPNGRLREEKVVDSGRLLQGRQWAEDGTPIDPNTGEPLPQGERRR